MGCFPVYSKGRLASKHGLAANAGKGLVAKIVTACEPYATLQQRNFAHADRTRTRLSIFRCLHYITPRKHHTTANIVNNTHSHLGSHPYIRSTSGHRRIQHTATDTEPWGIRASIPPLNISQQAQCRQQQRTSHRLRAPLGARSHPGQRQHLQVPQIALLRDHQHPLQPAQAA